MTEAVVAVIVGGMDITTPITAELTFTSGGEVCAATLARPAGSGPHPAVLLVHGFTCHRRARLEPYVAALVARGFAVLTYDPRHVGDSGGHPRNLVDPERLVEDALRAIALLHEHEQVGDHVAMVGFSFGGGIALEAAARHGGVAALAHVVGFVSPRVRQDDELLALLALVEADIAAEAAGDPPVTVPVCAPLGHPAVISAPDAMAGFALLDVFRNHPNAVPARSLAAMSTFAPAARAEGLTCPVHFHVCRDDTAVDSGATLALADRLAGATVEVYEGSHFDVFRPDAAAALALSLADFVASASFQGSS